jgi:hypothetical protein
MGGGSTGDRRLLACPQPGGSNARLVRHAVAADQVGRGVESRPGPLPDPPLNRGRRHPELDGLVQGEHPGLTGDEVVEGHGGQDRTPEAEPVGVRENWLS